MGTKVRLSLAVGDYEIIRALMEGTVTADGFISVTDWMWSGSTSLPGRGGANTRGRKY